MSFRTLHTAEILLPMGGAPATRNGAVLADESGLVLEIGTPGALAPRADARVDHQIVMPGVVNCHTHLVDARRRSTVPGGRGFIHWAGGLLSTRVDAEGDLTDAVAGLLARMRSLGTVAVGEVANDFTTLDGIARSGMRCRFMHELIGFREEKAGEIMARAREAEESIEWPEGVAYALAAHAPYSVSPELVRLIAERSRARGTFFYEHLAEDVDERTLYATGEGPWVGFLKSIGSWDSAWGGVGGGPMEYYDRLGLIDEHFVGVHLTDAGDDEIALLAARGASAILSPSSNIHITGRLPRFTSIAQSGMRFAFGTDGLGSNPGIDVFDEARIMLESSPDLPAGIILEALTTRGAEVLGFDDLGAIRIGTRPGLISVEIADLVDDLGEIERRIVTSPIRRVLVDQHAGVME
jgi:cytosine/adenosine deaminase-related metal-dependent hydrolase